MHALLLFTVLLLRPFLTVLAEDPEENMNAMEMIRHWGYPAESYDVTTEDGYILDLYRIPHGRKSEANSSCIRPTVLMVHGLATSCTQYFMNPPESSPAFILADAGFDVFLLNHRGTAYGKRHKTLKPTFGSKFWEYTTDELAKYDAPAVIDKVIEVSGQPSMYWIGNSGGTLVGFWLLADLPEYNSKIKALLQVGPVGVMYHVRGLIRFGLFWYRTLKPLADFYRHSIGSHEIFSLWPSIYRPLSAICSIVPYLSEEGCRNFLTFNVGPPSKTFNWTRLPVYLSHFPGGTSTWYFLHMAQMVTHGRAEHMDHSPAENMRRYGQETPPPYNYTNIDVPVYLYWGRDDWLTNPDDIEHYIMKNLKKGIVKGGLEVNGYCHLDFPLAMDNAERVWNPIAHLMKSLESGEICGR